MLRLFKTSSLDHSEPRGGDVSQMPSGWWMAPFLLSGTMFWLWFIPVLTKTVI
ncbi:hypothetical protein [Thalassobius sp. Cn5-15]|uniref:hypothetical protein n=1 Tax=Thalassobius sp. Cn5-15 TaxID=2917763 RepID=UPI001EF39ED4|nr:hypothetical protein [Thalassobius sp. Cn5-15]MCG7492827.1 hypothetical protein [Thalassobius sp. Cn5-15]